MTETPEKRRRPFTRFAALFLLVLAVVVGPSLMRHPDTPLPPRWNVFEPLRVADPITPLTSWKLDWATSDPAMCLQVLQEAGEAQRLDDLIVDENCGIEGRVSLSGVGAARIGPIETACATALRLAMWETHGVQDAAQRILGTTVTRMRHVGSYNCRAIRNSTRWSTHSTASAIDITGFDMANGSKIRLLNDWNTESKGAFLREVRNASCDWFGTTLGPDYNALHADHFHLQNKGWGTCQ